MPAIRNIYYLLKNCCYNYNLHFTIWGEFKAAVPQTLFIS